VACRTHHNVNNNPLTACTWWNQISIVSRCPEGHYTVYYVHQQCYLVDCCSLLRVILSLPTPFGVVFHCIKITAGEVFFAIFVVMRVYMFWRMWIWRCHCLSHIPDYSYHVTHLPDLFNHPNITTKSLFPPSLALSPA
jgi:hypothetical protein